MTFSKDGSGQDTPNGSGPTFAGASNASTQDHISNPTDTLASAPASNNSPALPTNPVSLAEAKVSLHALPEGVKEGDVVSLKVSRIDAAKNCAYLSQDGEGGEPDNTATEDNEGGEKMGDEESTDGAVTPPKNENGGIDSGLLTGPLSNLKNYLAQKSVDNQTRTYTK
jgi:hypothetical protein